MNRENTKYSIGANQIGLSLKNNSSYYFQILFLLLFLQACMPNTESSIKPEDRNSLTAFANNSNSLTPEQALGKKLFFDANLSSPAGQSCASCHNPFYGFSDPQHPLFSEGAIKGSFGNRNTPSLGYLSYNPSRYYSTEDSTYIGGFFWDGRAGTLEDQVHFPLFNVLEMNNLGIDDVVAKVQNATYANAFKTLYGENAFNNSDTAFAKVVKAIASYEKSVQLQPFTSKYDFYLRGETELSEQELRGLTLFNEDKAKCSACHPSDSGSFGAVLFTDFTYDNIGLPRNPADKLDGKDLGLAATTKDMAQNGQFKVPSLRNVALSAPYFHNGFFNTLEEAVRFYSERDVPGKYPEPEIPETVNRDELGDLKLTEDEIADITAFLNTLTDGFRP